ncbi:MAG: YaeQ family protein [Bdellovibrionales bacterium]|nr:YaeQ family protein [Bdellovibrionales bacterium]
MAFIEKFINFDLSINNLSTNDFHTIKLRIPKHPLEPIEHLSAKVLAFANSYTEGLKIIDTHSKQLPSLVNMDITEEIKQNIFVGFLDASSLRHSVKQHSNCMTECYFFESTQIENFCHQLRGSKTNWVDQLNFWELESKLNLSLVDTLETRNKCLITIVDSEIYINSNGREISGSYNKIDIWEFYQHYLNVKEFN